MFRYNKLKSRKGLTFLEVILSIFILAVALGGFSQIFTVAVHSSNRANHDIIASNLASGLMAEIMSRDFEEEGSPDSFTREEANDRWRFDDVDDYDDWSESPPITAGKPADGYDNMDGTLGTPNFSNYTRSVTVSFVDIPDGGGDITDADGSTNSKRITVTVSGPIGKDVSVTELKTKETGG